MSRLDKNFDLCKPNLSNTIHSLQSHGCQRWIYYLTCLWLIQSKMFINPWVFMLAFPLKLSLTGILSIYQIFYKLQTIKFVSLNWFKSPNFLFIISHPTISRISLFFSNMFLLFASIRFALANSSFLRFYLHHANREYI